jgi:hypothetical protein
MMDFALTLQDRLGRAGVSGLGGDGHMALDGIQEVFPPVQIHANVDVRPAIGHEGFT